MKRRETVETFRNRLVEVIKGSGLSRSAFAERAGLDRSTLSQLLSSTNERLPRAETIAAIAAREQVSVDWLLGLSQADEMGSNILTQAFEMEPGASSPIDGRLIRWHEEAVGYKIRYVPATLPDLLKTQEVTTHEFQEQGERVPEGHIEQGEARLANTRRPDMDLEVCSGFQSVVGFVMGEGIWHDLDLATRRRQMDHMITLVEELYPSFRWFLYDGLKRYAVPYTIFGPKRAAVYMGNMYLVLNSTEHIRVLIRHFEDLIRAAIMQPPEVIEFLKGLRRDMDSRSK